MFKLKREEWLHIGQFCDKELARLGKIYGTIKVQTIDKENVEADTRCTIEGCNEYVSFIVQKLRVNDHA